MLIDNDYYEEAKKVYENYVKRIINKETKDAEIKEIVSHIYDPGTRIRILRSFGVD
jgi:hypothetical protein